MTSTATQPNGTVSVKTLQDEDGRFTLAVVYVNGHGASVVLGSGYADMDTAKSSAWTLAQRFNAVMLPTRRVRP